MQQIEAKKIAAWQSKGGKYLVELFYNPAFNLANGETVISANYRGNNCGGGVPATDEADAIAQMQKKVDSGYFQADANKTPMRRIL